MRRVWVSLMVVAVLVGVNSPGAAARGGPPASLFPPVTVHDATAAESDEFMVFEVTLERATNRPTNFWYSTQAGTAQPGRDYVPVLHRRATIPRGETSTTVAVRLVDDAEPGDNLTFDVIITTAPPGLGGRHRATGTILDDDRRLDILHINDHHSHLQPDAASMQFDGVATGVRLGGFPRVVALFRQLEAALADRNVVKIHAGDAITGTLYYTLFEGQADAELMNELCFDVFALGNHEFDDGDAALAQFLDWLAEGDCGTSVLAANVVPELGTPLAPTSPTDYLQPYVVESYDGFDVGYVGIDIASKTQFSSQPLPTTQFLDEVTTAQRYIDELTEQGVDQIVLVTHYTYEGDLDLASQLRGVDVIVGGDSHTLLANDLDRFGLPVGGPYPTRTTDADGNLVCVVQAWQYSWAVGHLAVTFDGNGDVVSCDGHPRVVLSDAFTGEGVDPDRVRQIVAETPELEIVEPDAAAQAILETYAAAVAELEQTVVGEAVEHLCLERIPNQGRSVIEGCREQTAERGGDIQQLVTEAFRQRSFEADIAIQNAGGVRVDVPAGPITIATAYTVLPFSNTLVNLEMTGAEIIQVLEDAGAYLASNPSANSGAYPYAAGLRWDADLSAPTGSRFTNHEVRPKGSDEWVPLDPDATYTVVSNSFVAGGGDGYTTFRTVADDGRATDTFLNYAQTFIDYIVIDRGGILERLPASEYSTQSFIPFAPAP